MEDPSAPANDRERSFPPAASEAVRLIAQAALLKRIAGDATAPETVESRLAAGIGAITDAAPDAIITADANGDIAGWNRAAEKMFGHLAADAIGKPLTIIVPEEYRARHLTGL